MRLRSLPNLILGILRILALLQLQQRYLLFPGTCGSDTSKKITGTETGRLSDERIKDFYGKAIEDFYGTAKLGDECDVDFHNQKVKPIYEAIMKHEIAPAINLQHELLNMYMANSNLRSKSCFGFHRYQVFKNYNGSMTNYYKCDETTKRCVCLNEEGPLLHKSDPNSETGCKLVEPTLGSRCSRRQAEMLHKGLYKSIFTRFQAANSEEDYTDATLQWYGTDQYIMTIRQDYYAMQRKVCHNHRWSMECREDEQCVCRVQEPHFKFKPLNRDCLPETGSVCSYLNKNSTVTIFDSRCYDLGPNGSCKKVFFNGPNTLRACGGKTPWGKVKQEYNKKNMPNQGFEPFSIGHFPLIFISLIQIFHNL